MGSKSNGIVWPSLASLSGRQDESDEDGEAVDELEDPVNLRLLQLGMCFHVNGLKDLFGNGDV